jgi:hypothetical protein
VNLMLVNEPHGHYTMVHANHCHTTKKQGSKAKPWDEVKNWAKDVVFKHIQKLDYRICRICRPFGSNR